MLYLYLFFQDYFLSDMLLLLAGGLGACENQNEPKYDIYENHEISACGINDPLKNMDWLKEFCDSIKEKKDILSANIGLFKVIETGEHIFRIDVSPPIFKDGSYAEFFNCNGNIVYEERNVIDYSQSAMETRVPHDPNRWFEYVAELFRYVKQ